MSHAGILSYLATKEGLLTVVMARHDRIEEQQASRYKGVGILEFLEIGTTHEPDVLIRLGTVLRAENLNPGDPLYEYFRDNERRVRSLLAAAIRADQKRGAVRADIDPRAKAVELSAFAFGLDIQWLMDPDRVDRCKAYQSFARAQITDLTGVDVAAED